MDSSDSLHVVDVCTNLLGFAVQSFCIFQSQDLPKREGRTAGVGVSVPLP